MGFSMRKEVLIAVFIGLSMGLVITYGIYRVQTSLNEPPGTEVADVADENASALLAQDTPTILSLHSPEDGTVQTETAVRISGTTLPNTFVVLFAGNEDFITTSDESGNFSFSTDLKQGTNIITVHVVDENGAVTTAERVVVVTDMFSEKTTQDASSSAEAYPEA